MPTDKKADTYIVRCKPADVRLLAIALVASEHTQLVQIGKTKVGVKSHMYADDLLAYVKGICPYITKADLLWMWGGNAGRV